MRRFVMLFICLFFCLMAVGHTQENRRPYWWNPGTLRVNPGFFPQILDHFNNYGHNAKFDQRYWISTSHWRGNGPIFLHVAGEGRSITPMVGPWCQEFAHHFSALCFELEHRYYGFSSPIPIDAYTRTPGAALEFLSSKQAIEDIAYFIEQMNQLYNLHSHKWVLFGGSYAGSLVAWAKQKYPKLIFAAVSVSAPLEATVDQQLTKEECEASGNFYHGGRYLNTDETSISVTWTYQVCTEFGWYSNGTCTGSLEEDRVLLDQRCQEMFDPSYNLKRAELGIKATNEMFGGKEYNVDHTMFIHGSKDNWKHFGITESKNPLMPAWVIKGAGHCYPLFTDYDIWAYEGPNGVLQNVQEARVKIVTYLQEWLNEM